MLLWHRLRSWTHHSVAGLDVAQLERRVLFSVVPLPGALTNPELFDLGVDVDSLAEPLDGLDLLAADEFSDDSFANASGLELVFLDADLAGDGRFLQDLLSQVDDGRELEVIILDDLLDGVAQISDTLDAYHELEAIHIVTHGSNGGVQLGATWLSDTNIDQYRSELSQWNGSLADGADLLFYGCDLASSEAGRSLTDTISVLTGADVAASEDLTGAAKLGGDWLLEYETGDVATQVAFSASLQASWEGVLATVTVTQTLDEVNAPDTSTIATLMADDGGDGISLREAILAAQSGDEILLEAETYVLSIAGTGEDNAATGDLDIRRNIRITGVDAASTVIDGGELDRVIDVRAPATQVDITDLTITGGRIADKGGGIHIDSGSSVVDLQRVIISENFADDGAGVFNKGTLLATDVAFYDNGDGSTDEGGALHNKRSATLERVTIARNTATFGGGIHNDNSATLLTLTNSTVSSNTGFNSGGGLHNQKPTEIYNSTFTLNQAANGGGIHSNGGSLQLVNTIVADNTVSSANPDIMGGITSLGNNLIGDSTGGSGFVGSDLLDVDPLLAPLANGGGFGATHRLLPGSPAVDAAASGSAPAEDQNGVARPTDSDGDGTLTADIGAVEAFDTLVNTPDPGDTQETSGEALGSQQAIAVDGNGNYVVVWSSENQDGDGWGVYAKRYTSTGVVLTGEILVNTTTSDDQKWARVASDAAGNFVVTWTQVNGAGVPQDIYYRGFNADGTERFAEQVANDTTSGSQSDSVIAMESNGDFVIAWEGNGPSDANGIFFRRFSANGVAKDAADGIVNAASGSAEIDPAIAMLVNGSFVIAWENIDNNIFFQRFDDLGATAGSIQQIDAGISTSVDLALASDASGNFTFVYREETIASGIWRRGYHSDGSTNYGWARVRGGDVFNPSIHMAADGSGVITWQEQGVDLNVFARKMNPNGSFDGATFQVTHWTAGDQHSASVAMIDADTFAVTWSGEGADDNSGVYVKTFSPDVPLVNSPPTAITPNTFSIDENTDTAAGVSVGTLVAIDPDSGEDFLFSIEPGDDGALFSIGAADQLVLTDGVLDFETNNSYTVTVRVTDSGLNTYDELITVSVTDLNETPTAISPTAIPLTEGTDTTSGLSVATLATTDDDVGDTASYTLVTGGDSALFSISGADQLVLTNGVLDFETKSSYTVTVRVTDSALNTYDELITVSVSDVNETPTAISPAAIPLAEGTDTTGGLTVATLVTTDDDAGDTASYALVTGGDSALFSISGADQLVLTNGVLDFETKSSYTVTVRVTDGALNTYDELITVSVSDVNETPTAISPAAIPLAEGTDTTGGLTVATLVTTDDDVGDTASYTLVTGGDSALFSISGADQLVLTDGVLDFETKSSYTVTVRVTDSALNTYDELITVSVSDVNETPTAISPAAIPLAEGTDTTGGLTVATLATTDDDVGDTASYTLVTGGDSALFSISGADQLVLTDGVLDFETKSSYTVTVRVTDGALNTYDELITVSVSDVNETPTAISPAAIPLSEGTDTTGGLTVATLVTTDDDAGDTASYTLVTGGDSALFSIGGTDRLVLTDGVLDFETKSSYTVTVRVTDGALNTYDELITVSVSDVNETPTAISPAAIPLAEGTDTTGGLTVATLVTTDDDAGDTASYTLVTGGDSALFSIGGTDRLVLTDGVLDFEAKSSYTVTVRVTDGAFNTYDDLITVSVTDVNEAPTAISPSAIPVADGTDTVGGFSVATLTTTDEDAGDSASYQVLPGADAAFFSIGGVDSDELIIDAGSLDSSIQSAYSVTVRVTDGANNTYDELITVSVGDSPPTDIMPNAFSVDENTQTASGFELGTLTASDPNTLDTFVFSILPGADASRFSIGGVDSDRLILTDGTLDFETRASYTVNLRVTDSTLNTYDETIVVAVNDLVELPQVALSQPSFTLSENADVSHAIKVADITVTGDTTGNTTLSLAGDDAQWFRIVGNELRLRANVPLDYESDQAWDVLVQVDEPTVGGDVDDSVGFQLIVSDFDEQPVASNERFAVGFGTLAVSSPGVLANDFDPEGTALTVVLVAPPENGTLQLNNDGSFTYVPDNGFFGVDQFTYRVEDASGSSSLGVANLTVLIPLQTVSAAEPVASDSSTDNEDESTETPLLEAFQGAESSESRRTSGFPTPTRVGTAGGPTMTVVEPVAIEADGANEVAAAYESASSSAARDLRDTPVEVVTTQYVAAPAIDVPFTSTQMFGNAFDEIREQSDAQHVLGQMVVGTTVLLSSGLSVGYVIWLIRGGLLLSSLLSSMPAWRLIDPLPVLGFMDEDDQDDDDDSLSTLVAKSNSKSSSKVAS